LDDYGNLTCTRALDECWPVGQNKCEAALLIMLYYSVIFLTLTEWLLLI
jgi:hypothetical protein